MISEHAPMRRSRNLNLHWLLLFSFLSLSCQGLEAGESAPALNLNIGEEYTYCVKYGFIRLGTLRIVMEDTMKLNNRPVYKVKFFMDSNPYLFFVNIHSVFESYIDKQYRLQKLISHEEVNDTLYKARYNFNYDEGYIDVHYKEINDTTRTTDRRFELKEDVFGSVALIFYARENAYRSQTDTVTAFHETNKGKVFIEFKGEGDAIEIDVLDDPLPAYHIGGEIFMKGIAGVTGPFRGWFSKDAHRIPLKAELEVFIGSVKVELEDWNMWNPDEARDDRN